MSSKNKFKASIVTMSARNDYHHGVGGSVRLSIGSARRTAVVGGGDMTSRMR